MKSTSDRQALSQDAGEQDLSSLFASRENLITFTQDYYANDFSHSDSSECPSTAALQSQARSGDLPDKGLRTHLFACSECFRMYQSALAAYRAERGEVAASLSEPWWIRLSASLSLKPLPIFASAFSLLLLAFIGAYIWQQYRNVPDRGVVKHDLAPIVAPAEDSSRDNPPSASPETSSSIVTPVEQTERERLPKPNSQQTEPSPRSSNQGALVAMSTVRIDLENYAITRGGVGSGGEIKLISSRARLILALPEASDRGLYTVSIVDSSGNSLVKSGARSADGKNLTATLNLEKLTPQKYSLRISRAGESPINVPVVISTGKIVLPITQP